MQDKEKHLDSEINKFPHGKVLLKEGDFITADQGREEGGQKIDIDQYLKTLGVKGSRIESDGEIVMEIGAEELSNFFSADRQTDEVSKNFLTMLDSFLMGKASALYTTSEFLSRVLDKGSILDRKELILRKLAEAHPVLESLEETLAALAFATQVVTLDKDALSYRTSSENTTSVAKNKLADLRDAAQYTIDQLVYLGEVLQKIKAEISNDSQAEEVKILNFDTLIQSSKQVITNLQKVA